MSDIDKIVEAIKAKGQSVQSEEASAAERLEMANRVHEQAKTDAVEQWATIRPTLIRYIERLNRSFEDVGVILKLKQATTGAHGDVAQKEVVTISGNSKTINTNHSMTFTAMVDGHTLVDVKRDNIEANNKKLNFRTMEIGTFELDQAFAKLLQGASLS